MAINTSILLFFSTLSVAITAQLPVVFANLLLISRPRIHLISLITVRLLHSRHPTFFKLPLHAHNLFASQSLPTIQPVSGQTTPPWTSAPSLRTDAARTDALWTTSPSKTPAPQDKRLLSDWLFHVFVHVYLSVTNCCDTTPGV